MYINKSITSKSHLFSKHLTLENRYHFSLQNHQYIKAQSLKRRLIDYWFFTQLETWPKAAELVVIF